MEPSRGPADGRTPIVIHGDGFAAQVTQSASGGPAEVSTAHRAWVGDTPLEDVTWVDPHTLRATVPAGLASGSLPLVVENAFGRRGRLADAFRVVAGSGAAPSARTTLAPAGGLVTVGQPVAVAVEVRNGGFAAAWDVTAVLTVSSADGGALALTGPSPGSLTILDPDQTATFTWSGAATSAGHVTLSASVAAVDAFSGDALASDADDAAATVRLPAGLVATVSASRATADTGQAIGLTFTVTNGGAAPATLDGLVPSFSPGFDVTCTEPDPEPAGTLGPGQSAVFGWGCTSRTAGALALSGTASGADASSGEPLSASPAVPAGVTIQAPPTLALGLALHGPTTVSLGQPVPVTATVTNGGGAPSTVSDLRPVVTPASGAVCGAPSVPPPYPLAGGAGVSVDWTCVPTVAGTVTLGASASGVDLNTGGPLAAAAPAAALTVQLPAAIAAIVSASRTVASTGQAIAVTFTVTNGGTATANVSSVTPLATGVAATCGAVSPAPPLAIGAGQARTFTWSCTGSAAGTLSLSGTASATDANSGLALSATPATPASATIQAAAALTATAFTSSRTTADANQAVTVSLTLANGGGASARVSVVTPSITPTSAGSCTAASPTTATINGGTNRAFTWTCTPTSAGTRSLGVSVTWNDTNIGTNNTLSPTAISLTVQTPAALGAALSAAGNATTVAVGTPLAMSLLVTDTGGAGATVTSVTPSVSPPSAGSCTTPAPAVPQPLAGGGGVTFTWTCTASSTGNVNYGASVGGTDANTGAALSATASPVGVTAQ